LATQEEREIAVNMIECNKWASCRQQSGESLRLWNKE